ncbi:LPXTG cell wall anchor domain-containing protein [Enterococcus avium]|uniref:LPXTG cell wall anchor domain-containing protein n=1 Tax=Enterococcus avium TaxID=33945 RepID=UPI00232BE8FE|nr:LPXTG cell wall anchor domain-containing protein [Enterococcus avium]MDB1751312.1 LPXTG cell wall anchor domain-containing protein [Enterococcus avium]MDB1755492.1 LPXTG cell wall anchor domain-containing protein [Enterococcus avium]MDB1762557.1 LPXTG cell wall anchor domain-containing protein [Enterococcus avium]
MKTQIGILLVFLSLFVVPSPTSEAAVTNGKVQYYYESSTATSDSSTASSQSNTSVTSNSTTDVDNHKETPASSSNRSSMRHSSITRFLQTNDQRNIFLVIIGLLILAIAFLGWRIVKNRRKNE